MIYNSNIPKYISKPQYLAPIDACSADDDFSVLVDREIIQNMTQNICNTLHHPVTFLDVNRISQTSLENARIDSEIDYFAMRPTCRLFRHCAGRDMCMQCDAFHAKIFDDPENMDAYITKHPSFFSDKYNNNLPRMLQGFSRTVLEYHCPILGYRELLFPLFYEKSLIGVIFLGQTLIRDQGDMDLIKSISEDFFKKHSAEKIFEDFLKKNSLKTNEANTIKEKIIDADFEIYGFDDFINKKGIDDDVYGHKNMIFYTYAEYYDFIKRACNEIGKIEDQLREHVKEKQIKYFEKVVSEVVKYFFVSQQKKSNTITDPLKARSEKLESAWGNLFEATKKLQKELLINNVILFGDGIYGKVTETKEKHIYPLPETTDPLRNVKYDFSIIEKMQPETYDFICSLESENLFDGLKNINGYMNIANAIILVYPDIAILMEVTDRDDNKELYKEMAHTIGKSFSRIRTVVSLCASKLMQERHILTLRMNRHESLNISTKLGGNMKRYLGKDGIPFVLLDNDKKNNIINDLNSAINLISNMAQNIGLITGSITQESISKHMYERVDIFELLHKLQIMFRDTLEQRNLDIVLSIDQTTARAIYTNNNLFELLVYNLVENAVKYAYRGSVIRLKWFAEANRNKLAVISYGPQMRNEDHPYELYSRGKEAVKGLHSVQGDGIGLYVVKRIEKLLNIKVYHYCEKISDYCIPLIDYFLAEKFFNKNSAECFKNQLINYCEFNRISEWDDIINKHEQTMINRERKDVTQEYLLDNIERCVWKTVFYVVI